MIMDEDEEDESLVMKDITDDRGEDNGAIWDVCLNALTNQLKRNTITLFGIFQDAPVRILIDTGSTHIYIHDQLVQSLSLKQQDTKPFVMTLVDGRKATSNSKCPQVKWKIQGYQFGYNLRTLDLGD